jgi:hypothetical protein
MCPKQGVSNKLLGLLLIGQHTGQRWQIERGWPDIPWLARDMRGLVAAMFETWNLP